MGMQTDVDVDALQDVYGSLINLIGKENTLLLWNNYKGVQLSLPSHLYNREKVIGLILSNSGPVDPRTIAVKYGYSEKWVRQVLRQRDQVAVTAKEEDES